MTTITPVSSVYTSFVPATVKKPVASDAAAPVSNRFHASEPNALMKALANKYDLSNMDVSQYDAMCGELFGKIPSEQSTTLLMLGIPFHQPPGSPPADPNMRRNLVENAHDYLAWAQYNEPQSAASIQGVIDMFQTMQRLKEGQPASHWVA
jgi:hypothetical protein